MAFDDPILIELLHKSVVQHVIVVEILAIEVLDGEQLVTHVPAFAVTPAAVAEVF